MVKVAKFGGSSVAGAQQFEKVKAIVEADPARKVVVVSAAGKRSSGVPDRTGVTAVVNAKSRQLKAKTFYSQSDHSKYNDVRQLMCRHGKE